MRLGLPPTPFLTMAIATRGVLAALALAGGAAASANAGNVAGFNARRSQTLLQDRGGFSRAQVKSIEKVVTLLAELKADVIAEGKKEAKTYEEFACFCKDTTAEKSESVTSAQDTIQSLAAQISSKTAEQAEMEGLVEKRRAEAEALNKKLQATQALYEKKKSDHEAAGADISRAIGALEKAIRALESSKPTAALVQRMRGPVRQGLELADALGLIDSSRLRALSAFIQGGSAVDPADPEYKFQSQGVIGILENLLKDYQGKNGEIEGEWEQSKDSLKDMIASVNNAITESTTFTDQAMEKINQLKSEIADTRESLVSAEGLLKDDQHYLDDLTSRCQERARDFDKSSTTRANEIKALSQALATLSGLAETALVQRGRPTQANPAKATAVRAGERAIALLQLGASGRRVASAHVTSEREQNSLNALRDRALELLRAEGQRLRSAVLLATVASAAADPFAKVKDIIQGLIERLLKES